MTLHTEGRKADPNMQNILVCATYEWSHSSCNGAALVCSGTHCKGSFFVGTGHCEPYTSKIDYNIRNQNQNIRDCEVKAYRPVTTGTAKTTTTRTTPSDEEEEEYWDPALV